MTIWLAAVAAVLAIGLRRGRSPAARLRMVQGATGPSRRGWAATAAAGFALGAGAVAVGAPLPAVALIGVGIGVGLRVRAARTLARAREARSAAVIEVTVALAGELRAGRTPAEALAAAAVVGGPLAEPLLAARAAASLGRTAADELARAATLPGAERLRYVASAWQVAETAGGRVAAVLDRLGDAMDRDEELRRELDAALAAPRATMTLLAGLPVFGVLLGQAMGARPLHLLLDKPIGWGLLSAAVVLDAAGIWLTGLITRFATRC